MSNVRGATYTCPECGFSVQTPFGPEDATEHVKLHAEKHHNDKVVRARITKSELIKLQKSKMVIIPPALPNSSEGPPYA